MKINVKSIKLIAQYWSDLFQHSPRRFIIVLILSLINSLTAGLGILLILPLLDIIGINTVTDAGQNAVANYLYTLLMAHNISIDFIDIMVIYILVIFTTSLTRYYFATQSAILQQAYIKHLRKELCRGILYSRWDYLQKQSVSTFTYALSSQIQGVGHCAQLSLTLIKNTVMILILTILASAISIKLTLLALALSLLAIFLLSPINRFISTIGNRELGYNKKIFHEINEQLLNIKAIKAFNGEDFHLAKLKDASNKLESQHVNYTQAQSLTQLIFINMTAISFGLFLYIAISYFTATISTTILLLIAFSRIAPTIIDSNRALQHVSYKGAMLLDIQKHLQECQDNKEPSNGQNNITFNHTITLNNISYTHPNTKKPTLFRASIKINKGDVVAIIGKSGSGKSTLADLLSGLILPSSGIIMIDDQPLKPTNQKAWRNNIAYVTQESFFFHASIRDNISWIRQDDISEGELQLCLRLSAADKFISQLPYGLDTSVGQRGTKISGGERQRLAIARALLFKPTLLILDEATNALDAKNANLISELIDKLDKQVTILVISHDATLLSKCTKTIEVNDGSLHLKTPLVERHSEQKQLA